MTGAGVDQPAHAVRFDPSGDPHGPGRPAHRLGQVADARSPAVPAWSAWPPPARPTGSRPAPDRRSAGPGRRASARLGRGMRGEPDEGVATEHGRASAGDTSSWPTWTPSAPTSAARSGRSLRTNGTPAPAQTRLRDAGPGDQGGVGEVLLAQLDDVDAPSMQRPTKISRSGRSGVHSRARRLASSAPACSGPGGRATSVAHPGLGSLARASAFICCLNWRTLARASGESMSATDRCEPASP